jgi:DNA-binding CsgD family transcriptional regulator
MPGPTGAGSAEASLTREAALKLRCDGARTPLLGPDPLHLRLTTREREVAALVLAGLSDPRSPGKLWLSTRIVNNSLGRVCHTRDIHSRAQLAELVAGRADR